VWGKVWEKVQKKGKEGHLPHGRETIKRCETRFALGKNIGWEAGEILEKSLSNETNGP